MCLHPMLGFDTGTLTDKGMPKYMIIKDHFEPTKTLPFGLAFKAGYSIDKSRASWTVHDGVEVLKDPIPIPCGHCWQCMLEAAKNWTVRGVLEAKYHRYNYFLTLTYDEEHLIFNEDGQAVLSFQDHQRFLKRFRLYLSRHLGVPQKSVKVRFLGCGEYGETTGRPHLHYILFMDVPLPLAVSGINRFHCDLITRSWTKGLHDVSFCEPGCIAYVSGYVVKKAKHDVSMYGVSPFRCMSRKPGLGRRYFDEHPDMLDTLKVYGDFGSSHAKSLPRYFRVLLGDEYKALKDKLKASAEASHVVDSMVYGHSSYEELGFAKGEYLARDIFSKEDKL